MPSLCVEEICCLGIDLRACTEMIMPRDGNAIRTAYFQLLSGTTMIRLLSAKGSLVLSRDLIGLLLSLVAM
jgi:hypothetical protein